MLRSKKNKIRIPRTPEPGPDQEPVPLYAKASGKDQDTILPGATVAANKIFTWSVSVPFAEKIRFCQGTTAELLLSPILNVIPVFVNAMELFIFILKFFDEMCVRYNDFPQSKLYGVQYNTENIHGV